MYRQIYILSYLAIFLVSNVCVTTDEARKADACTNSRKNILVFLGHSFARTKKKLVGGTVRVRWDTTHATL